MYSPRKRRGRNIVNPNFSAPSLMGKHSQRKLDDRMFLAVVVLINYWVIPSTSLYRSTTLLLVHLLYFKYL